MGILFQNYIEKGVNIVVTEHIFVYSRVSRNVRYKYHTAETREKLDLEAEEIIDEMLDWDGTELWARYPCVKPRSVEAICNDFCEYVKHKYPDAVINPIKI